MLIGASGAGKSVIIKHLMGLFKPSAGEIRVFGKNIVPMGVDELYGVRSHLGYCSNTPPCSTGYRCTATSTFL